jgi:hypothetical protein
VSLEDWFPAFQMIVVPSSSGSSNPGRSLDPANKALRPFEASRCTRPTTKRHIPEDFKRSWLTLKHFLSPAFMETDQDVDMRTHQTQHIRTWTTGHLSALTGACSCGKLGPSHLYSDSDRGQHITNSLPVPPRVQRRPLRQHF